METHTHDLRELFDLLDKRTRLQPSAQVIDLMEWRGRKARTGRALPQTEVATPDAREVAGPVVFPEGRLPADEIEW